MLPVTIPPPSPARPFARFRRATSRIFPKAPSLRGRLSLAALCLVLIGICMAISMLVSEPASAQDAPAEPQGTTVTQSTDAAYAGVDEEKLKIDWLAEMGKGGVTALVQILLGVAMVAFALERFWSVRAAYICPKALAREVRPLWPAGEFKKLQATCKADGSVLAQVIQYMVKHRAVPLDIMSVGAGDVAARELKRHMQRAYPLAVIATLEPLLGLLGTIIGMVEAFNKVALLGDTGDASMLADAIGKALITTAVGLILAIPALALYHYFRQRISLLGTVLEEQVEELVSYWMLGVDSTDEVEDGVIAPTIHAPLAPAAPSATGLPSES